MSSAPLCTSVWVDVIAWPSAFFCFASFIIVTRRAVIEFNVMRFSCFLMSLITLGLCVINLLRACNDFPLNLYYVSRDLITTLYFDLMVAITLNLGEKFYPEGERGNWLWWATILGAAIMNISIVIGLTFMLGFPYYYTVGNILDLFVRIAWPVVGFLAYCYAFYPVINMKTGGDNIPSAVVAVGTWYLTGMGTFLLLHLLAVILVIPFPSDIYPLFDINRTAAGLDTRAAMMAFYSIPPSNKIIISVRHYFFPSSRVASLEGVQNTVPHVSADRFEMHLGNAVRLPDNNEYNEHDSKVVNLTTGQINV